ncbi:hypothetical protein EDB80DRAFT_879920 [Ilyonectria destructans]|nr:hypothetical protein EDB80DRAFT_879920 [Ilyonectria destructans]
MHKRYVDIGPIDPTMNLENPPRKTQRSHEENQERAYIAASRRSDRSIEARVQSARMASDVHKARTGKALRISEAIVIEGEMYEEEEEDRFLRFYQLRSPNLQTSSAEMNSQVDAYLKSRMSMSDVVLAKEQDWRKSEINRAFAQHFPLIDQNLSQRWSTANLVVPPLAPSSRLQNDPGPSFEPNFQPVNWIQKPSPDGISHSPPGASPPDTCMDGGALFPSALTPEFASRPETPEPQSGSGFESTSPTDYFMDYGFGESAFTNELPLKAKRLMPDVVQRDVLDPILDDQQRMYADVPLISSEEVSLRANIEDEQEIYCDLCENSQDLVSWDPQTLLE